MKIFIFLLCISSSFASSYTFGVQGRDGRTGLNGRNGQDGNSVSVHANGQYQNFDLNGLDAGDATQGENGSDARACVQQRARFNERGADGGDGGNGGFGGSGGNGGDAIIFYNNIADLRNISISNSGGRAGMPGSGGYAGRGCQCFQRSWSHRICSTQTRCRTQRVCDRDNRNCRNEQRCNPVRVCRNEYFTCSDGQSGHSGINGQRGREGSYGQVKLVQGLDHIPVQNNQATLTLGQLEQADFVLSKQIWQTKQDGRSLFASDSNISGTYQKFIELRTHVVTLKWQASQSIENFKDFKLGLVFDGNKLMLDIPEGILVKYQLVSNEQGSEILIQDIYTVAEASRLGIASTQGYGGDLVVTINDKQNISDKIKNEVKLQWVHRKWRIWYVVYDKMIPQEFVDSFAEKIEINVGKIGIPSAYISRGKLVRYTLWIKRSLGSSVTEVKLYQPAMNLR